MSSHGLEGGGGGGAAYRSTVGRSAIFKMADRPMINLYAVWGGGSLGLDKKSEL